MIYEDVQSLIDYAIKNELMTQDDVYVVRNQLMEQLGLTDWETPAHSDGDQPIDTILGRLVDYACEKGIISDTTASRDLYDTRLMGVLTPFPREVIAEFKRHYQVSPQEATDWYFRFSEALNYVRAGRIAKDLKWTYESEYGTLGHHNQPFQTGKRPAGYRTCPVPVLHRPILFASCARKMPVLPVIRTIRPDRTFVRFR